jgi:hypothetical protein
MARNPQAAGQATQGLGARPGLKFYSPAPFSGINTYDAPPSIEDAEFTYLQNFLRLGNGNLRTQWDYGAPIYTATGGLSIVYFYAFNIGTTQYWAIFLSDGSAVQYDVSTTAVTQIGPSGTFYDPISGFIPACAQYGAEFLLIANRNTTNDYWAWDGSLLYGAGTAAVLGATLTGAGNNYTSLPTVTPYGGVGTGMVIQPVIEGGQVVNLNITNPGTGYEINDVVQLQFSGGGSDTGAILQAQLQSGSVSSVIVTAPGSGYTSATVAFSGGGGVGAAGTVIIGSGVSSVTVTASGSGYTSAPVVSFTGGSGSGASAVAIISGGIVIGVDILSQGSGYTSAPTVVFSGGGGSSAAATAATNYGQIIGVTITNGGTGYTSSPTVAFSGTGGAGATGAAVLSPGSISGVNVINGGSGYTYPPTITFQGGGGTGASGVAQLSGTSIAKVNIISPGQNYQQVPTVKFVGGGGGSGATAVAVLGGGGIVAINVTNGGSGYTQAVEVIIEVAGYGTSKPDTGSGAGAVAVFQPTSIASVQMSNYGTGYTSTPAVVISPGANNSAYGLVNLMPFGVSGSTMETFQGRVWIANPAQSPYSTVPPGGNFQVSAPGSITNFATSSGGVQFTNSDAFLETQYVGVKQSNGYLYLFGDSSVSVISGVTTSGTPPTTTFSYQNVDPDTGLSWRDSLTSYGRSLIFGSNTGIYGLYGGSVTRISDKLVGLFNNAIFPPTAGAIEPSSALATLFDIRHFLMLMTITDPDTGQPANVMATWNEKTWTLSTQSVNLIRIATQHIGSGYTAYGTDGTSLYPLFQTPSTTLVKRLDTKFYGSNQPFMIKDWDGLYVSAQDQSSTNAGINVTCKAVVSGLSQQSAYDPSVQDQTTTDTLIMNQDISMQSPNPYWAVWATGTGGLPFVNMSLRLTSTSPDFVLNHFVISYTDDRFIGA